MNCILQFLYCTFLRWLYMRLSLGASTASFRMAKFQKMC